MRHPFFSFFEIRLGVFKNNDYRSLFVPSKKIYVILVTQLEDIYMKRNEQKIEDTWDLSTIYSNEDLLEKDIQLLTQQLHDFKAYKGHLHTQLLEALHSLETMEYLIQKIYVYIAQSLDQDTSNHHYQQLFGQANQLMVQMASHTAFFEPELLTLDEALIQKPEMAPYARYLDQILNQKAHILDSKTEALLAASQDFAATPTHVFQMFNNADIRFEDIQDQHGITHPMSIGQYTTYMESNDRTLRKHAFDSLYASYKQFNNTLATCFEGHLKQENFFATQRHYKNAYEQAMYQNEIPLDVYTNLIQTVHKNMDKMHHYVSIRKKALGLKELHMYDLYTPLVASTTKSYSFEEACEIVKKGLAPLGEDYIALLEEGFTHRWIDKYENEGKRTGAYSWGCFDSHPFVLLNYHGTLNDVFTLAHEMGHSIHSYYSRKHQNIFNADYKIFVAEVASTCNEALLVEYLLRHSTDVEDKKYLLNYFSEQIKGTLYRQTMFAEFEYDIHQMVNQGKTLNGQLLNEHYYKLNQLYFGDEMVIDDAISYEWSRIPHFYTPFYVYQYATGISAAIAIATKILNHEEGIVEKYKQFLSSGCTATPIELLKICGVDMSTSQPIQEALDRFESYLNQLESLL